MIQKSEPLSKEAIKQFKEIYKKEFHEDIDDGTARKLKNMTEKNFNLKDESGDKNHFTQIPNMIVNHSTAYEQSLYLIMKRLAGEGGQCFASMNFLAKKMGVDKKTARSSIRFSVSRMNTREEIDTFLSRTVEIVQKLRR